VEEVFDAADQRLAPYSDLKDSALRRKAELHGGYFVVEGRLAMEAVLASPYPLESVLVLRRRLGVLDGLPLAPATAVYVVDEPVMAGVTGFDVHRGLLGLGRRLPGRPAESLLEDTASRVVVVVEGVNDQENLGAIFRNAAAFAAGALFLDPTSSDPLYRRTVRVSLGHSLRVPFARLVPWPESLDLLGKNGFVLLALTPATSAEPVQSVADALHGSRVALLVGAERSGLSDAVLRSARRVRIPMAAGVDSLNVATALGVALHGFADFGR